MSRAGARSRHHPPPAVFGSGFFFSSRRRHTRWTGDWSSDVCSSDLTIFYGYDCRSVSSFGAEKAGIEHAKEKMVGRGVLLDIARHQGMDWLPEGFAITNDMLDKCATAQNVEVGRGDHLLIRTGQMEEKLNEGSWDGYPGGDAPGLAFETLDWLQDRQVAAVATDTWGVEVRPNNCDDANQPWHWICIPI